MPVTPQAVEFLRARGHETVHAFAIGLGASPDEVILERARGEKRVVVTADLDYSEVLGVLHEVEPSLTLRYNKHYVGTGKDGQPMNFVILKPKKEWIRVEVKLERSDDIQARLEQAGSDLLEYSPYGRYQFRLRTGDAQKQRSLLTEVFRLSYDEFGR